MRLSHNLESLSIYSNYKSTLLDQNKAMKNIASGVRINSSSDDPYGMAENNIFTMQIKGLQTASQNAQDTISLLQTTEGGLNNMDSMLQRIRELAVEAGNGTNNDSDKRDIQLEVSKLVGGIDNLAKSTNMNGVSLLNGSASVNSLIGANAGENISIPMFNFQASNLQDASGNTLSDVDVTTSDGANKALNVIDAAMDSVNKARSKYGAIENRLSTSITNMNDSSINAENGDSNVMDADVASEMMRYSKDNILVQAGIAMMAQTNKFPQQVLSILANVK